MRPIFAFIRTCMCGVCVVWLIAPSALAVQTDQQAGAEATKQDAPASPTGAPPKADTAAEQVNVPPLLSSVDLAAALLGGLTPEHLKSLGEMLETDWKNRPEWGDMAVAILKNNFMGAGKGWWRPGAKRYDWEWIKSRFDHNSDDKVARDEFPSDLPAELPQADVLFDRLDRDLDGQLSSADFDWSGRMTMNMQTMQNQMVSFLFYRLDKDSNGRVSEDELADFFVRADRDGLGFLTAEDLLVGLDDGETKRAATRTEQAMPTANEALRMFFRGELGSFEAGPDVGDLAPDFTLPRHDGSGSVTLSGSRGKKPVVLIFGSFT